MRPPEGGALSIEDLYASHAERLTRTAYLLTSSRSDAEEIVQEAFTALLRVAHRVDTPDAYLHRSVVNRCKSLLRHRAIVRRVMPALASRPEQDEVPHTALDLTEALGQLSVAQRAAIVLRYFNGKTDTEIAAILKCRPATVRSHLHRGINHLRERLVVPADGEGNGGD